MCVMRISILPLSKIFLLDFGTVLTVFFFLSFYLLDFSVIRKELIIYFIVDANWNHNMR